jgi:hypothetical protein
MRTIGDNIKALKAELPPKDEDGHRPQSPLDGEIQTLEAVRRHATLRFDCLLGAASGHTVLPAGHEWSCMLWH